MIKTTFVRITDLRFQPVKHGHEIITSLEGENPGKSIKDRIVFGELSDWLAQKNIKKGDCVAEISAGSTALSLAYYCRIFDLRCSLFVPKSLDPAIVHKLQSYGADLHLLDPQGAQEKYDQFIAETGYRKFDQFGNANLRKHYHSLADEISRLAKIQMLIGAVGTGHSLVGVSQRFSPSLKVVTAEPLKPASVSGIRNLKLETFGEKDPCAHVQLERIELREEEFFPDQRIETDKGWIEFSDSFRVVLGAIDQACKKVDPVQWPLSIFAVGAKNLRSGS